MRRTLQFGLLLALGGAAAAVWLVQRESGQEPRQRGKPVPPVRPVVLETPSSAAPGHVVSGVVRAADTRQGVAGARVLTGLARMAETSPVGPVPTVPDFRGVGVVTDSSGGFSLRAVPVDEEVAVCVLADGYETYSRSIDGDQLDRPLEIIIEAEEPHRYLVVDEDGKPIARAHALLYPRVPGLDGVPVAEAWSARDGTFSLQADTFDQLVVARQGYATVQRHADFWREKTIVMRRGLSLRVTVRDSSSSAVGGARVRLRASDARFPKGRRHHERFRGTTSPGGVCLFSDLPFALWDIKVEAEGFVPESVSDWSGAEVSVLLQRAASVVGEVRLPDGTPARGAKVHGDRWPPAKSGPDGTFRLDRCTPGRISIRATLDEGLAGSETLELNEGERREGVVVRLEPRIAEEPAGLALRLRVVDWNGAPAPGMGVLVQRRRARPAAAVIDKYGRACLPELPEVASYHPRVFGLTEAPHSDAPVTDANGRAVIRTRLPPGSPVIVRVFPTEWAHRRFQSESLPEPGKDALAAEAETVLGRSEPVEVQLPKPIRFTFRVRESSAEELPFFWFRLHGNARFVTVSATEESYYLDPADTYHVLGSRWRPPAGVFEQEIRPAPAHDAPRDDKPPAPVAKCRGRVIAMGGRPVGGALVTPLFERAFAEYYREATATDGNGRFELRVAEDVEFLRITRRGYGARIVRLRNTREVVLQKEGTLRIHIASDATWDARDWRIDLGVQMDGDRWHWSPKLIVLRDGQTFYLSEAAKGNLIDAEARRGPNPYYLRQVQEMTGAGSGTVKGLDAGRVRVRLWSSGFEQVRERLIRSGVVTDVAFQLPR